MSIGKQSPEKNMSSTQKGITNRSTNAQTTSSSHGSHLQNVLVVMQRQVGNQATAQWVHSRLVAPAQKQRQDDQKATPDTTTQAPIQKYPYINSDPPKRTDSQIYGIYVNKKPLGKPIYVGQTTLDRAGARFIEHIDYDSDQPWHVSNDKAKGYDSGDVNQWPFVPGEIERLKDVTKFEVTAAEQYWWEIHGNRKLRNKQQPLLNSTFHKYKDIDDNYDASRIGLSGSWEPKDM